MSVATEKKFSIKKLSIEGNEIHVWSVNLNQPKLQIKKLQLYLSTDEQQRAQRFFFEKDKKHFIVARGMLRKFLSFYINRQPYEFMFEYNKFGKPFLPIGFNGNKFRFNLSHSHGKALYAFTLNHEVGIDIEYIREDFDDLEIAKRFFSPDEVTALHSLPPENQKEAFFLCWTRKEAFIKAKGKGLSIPLDQFDVSLTPGQPAQLLRTKYDRKDVSHWSLFNLTVKPGFAAALAVQGSQEWQLKFWDWKESY
ncbi:MAG: 4'-phosphopantetheinyl transferase superfamily protein [bacterium]|nr:MAG: 4'-phosphopantetheinyl transferase superfamily protein [bacterium]